MHSNCKANIMPAPYYLHVQDFVDAYIGPFPSERAACEHYLWTKEVRGDGATIMGISTQLPPAGEMLLTPEADKTCEPASIAK